KDFSGPYIDERGQESEKTYSIFVRDLKRGIVTNVEPMSALFEKAGHVRKVLLDNGAFFKIMGAKELFDFTVENMRKEPNLLYYEQRD
ncbi:MAG: hypothetical protein ABIJ26_03525, partial [Candidatus Margulisiibacteriota bacterium]